MSTTYERTDTRTLLYLMHSVRLKVTCLDELFDILWELHLLSGHMKTPATLHALAVERGLWGIPREACKIFVHCCLICSMSKRILKKQESCKPIYASTYNDRSQMDLIDMRTIEFEEYNWILRTIDLNTKYGCAIALKGKHASDVGRFAVTCTLQSLSYSTSYIPSQYYKEYSFQLGMYQVQYCHSFRINLVHTKSNTTQLSSYIPSVFSVYMT